MAYVLEPEAATAVREPPRDRYILEPSEAPAPRAPSWMRATPPAASPAHPAVRLARRAPEELLGVGETAAHLVGAAIEPIVPGLAAVARTAVSGPARGAETLARVRDILHPFVVYEPQTEAGKRGKASFDWLFGLIPRSAQSYGEKAQRVGEAIGGPEGGVAAGTIADTALQMAAIFSAPALGRIGAKLRRRVPLTPQETAAVEQAMTEQPSRAAAAEPPPGSKVAPPPPMRPPGAASTEPAALAAARPAPAPLVLPPEDLAVLDQIRDEVSFGPPGSRVFIRDVEKAGAPTVIGEPSSYPEYFKNKGYTKAHVLRILDQTKAGRPITEKQRAVVNDLLTGFRAQATRAAAAARWRVEPTAPAEAPRRLLGKEPSTPEIVLAAGATEFPFKLEPQEMPSAPVRPTQGEIPGLPRQTPPPSPRQAISPEGPTPVELAAEEAERRAKQAPRPQAPQFEEVGGPTKELGLGVPLTRQSFFQWQVAWERLKAKVKPLQAQAEHLAPHVTFSPPARDMGWMSMFGTPANRLKRYGPAAEAAINDLNLTEMRQIRAIGQRNEADAMQGFAKIPGRDLETFWDAFEGKPLEEILARPDLSPGTKEAARFFRSKFDLDRGTIILLQRDRLRPAMAAKVEAQLRVEGFARAGSRRTKAEMETFRAEVARRVEADVVKAVPDTWGITDYLPHMFPSEYRVLVENAEGGMDFIGGANSKWEAQAVIAKHFVDHPSTPAAQYHVETRMFMDPDVVRVSTPRRWKLIHDLSKAAGVTKEDVANAMKGLIGTREGKAKWWGALRHREGAVGYSRDLQWVMQTYNAGLVRWATITDLNRRLQPTLRAMRNKGQTQLAGEIEANLKILSGYKSSTSDLLDTTLAHTPGIRVIAQPFALERWTNRLKGFTATAFLKLSPRFHFLNRFQMVQTLWPIVDSSELLAGIRLFRTAEGRAILDQYGVRFLAARGKVAEAPGLRLLRPRMLERLRFLAPETSNQEIAFLTMYQKGVGMGMLPSRAADYAFLRGNLYSQFVALRTDMPRMLYRGIWSGMPAPVKSLAFQFQRFTVKDLEIGLDLLRSAPFIGGSKWLIGHLLMGGARAFASPFLWLPGAGHLSLKAYNAIKAEYGDDLAGFLYYGLPSLLNMDLSYSVQFVNPPYGDSVAEKIGNVALGPLGSLAISVGRAAQDTKGIEPSAARRALRAAVQRAPSLRWIEGLDKVWTGNYDFRDPAGRLRFHGNLNDVLMQIGAFRSLRQAEQDQFIGALMDIKARRDAVLDEAAAISLQRLQVKQPTTPDALARAKATVDQWNALFPEFPITERDLIMRLTARAKAATIPQQTRQLLRAPRAVRQTFLERLRPTHPTPGGAP